MSFDTVYNETKTLINNFRTELYRALVKKRFEKMLDAFIKSISLASTIGTGLSLNTTKFNIFGKPDVLIAPTGSNTPVSSDMPQVKLSWYGSKVSKTVNGESVDVIPTPEFIYDTSIVEGMYYDGAEILNKYPVVVAIPVEKKDQYPGYDFEDYAYIYFLPTTMYYLGMSDWVSVSNPVSFKSLAELAHIGSGLGWEGVPNMSVTQFRGHIGSFYFANITSGVEYTYHFYFDCEAKVQITDASGTNTDEITIHIPFIFYTGEAIADPDAIIRVGDVTQFVANVTTFKYYAYMPNYTLSKGVFEIGDVPYGG